MSNVSVESGAREATIEMIVTRADGTVENLGVVTYWHRNPLKRLWWRTKKYLGKKLSGRSRSTDWSS